MTRDVFNVLVRMLVCGIMVGSVRRMFGKDHCS